MPLYSLIIIIIVWKNSEVKWVISNLILWLPLVFLAPLCKNHMNENTHYFFLPTRNHEVALRIQTLLGTATHLSIFFQAVFETAHYHTAPEFSLFNDSVTQSLCIASNDATTVKNEIKKFIFKFSRRLYSIIRIFPGWQPRQVVLRTLVYCHSTTWRDW
jgi:hypothetical protein